MLTKLATAARWAGDDAHDVVRLVQEEPAPDEADSFKADWLRTYDQLPPRDRLHIYAASDYAVTAAAATTPCMSGPLLAQGRDSIIGDHLGHSGDPAIYLQVAACRLLKPWGRGATIQAMHKRRVCQRRRRCGSGNRCEAGAFRHLHSLRGPARAISDRAGKAFLCSQVCVPAGCAFSSLSELASLADDDVTARFFGRTVARVHSCIMTIGGDPARQKLVASDVENKKPVRERVSRPAKNASRRLS